MVSVGSLRNSSQVHRLGSSISPVIENVQSVSGVRGVGPADSTGKSLTRYWPGGRRSPTAFSRDRPRKPRETKLMVGSTPGTAATAPHIIHGPPATILPTSPEHGTGSIEVPAASARPRAAIIGVSVMDQTSPRIPAGVTDAEHRGVE